MHEECCDVKQTENGSDIKLGRNLEITSSAV